MIDTSDRPVRTLIAGVAALMAMMTAAENLYAQPSGYNYDEDKVPQFVLPDPLVDADGNKVTSAEQWTSQRRPQILNLFEDHVFGQVPSTVPQLRTRVRSEVHGVLDGKAIRREITVFFTDDDEGPSMDLLVYTPADASGPVPAFLGLNFHGNHSVDPDPAIHITTSWVRNDEQRGNIDHRATDESRGKSSSRWPVSMIVGRGYGLVTIYYGDIDPDFDDGFKNGVHQILEPDAEQRAGNAGGSISAWTWGLSRALDVLQTDPLIDGDKVCVFGHSRLGKTSLWAGATDPRFAMVISNNSGCGGAALSRRRFGETVKRINTSFPHWFCLNHRNYNDNEDALPVDHHMLMALIAPRPVYVASAQEDLWADPKGEMLSLYLAGPVYGLFGRKGLPSDAMPEVNHPVHADVAYHIRTGKHDVTDFDWEQYMNFADGHLK
jgi:hypothetical protein